MGERTEMQNGIPARSILRWWPSFIGGLLLPIASLGLRMWFHPALAAAIAFFVLFSLVGLLFRRYPPTEPWRLSTWLVGALAGALLYGGLTYLRPWG